MPLPSHTIIIHEIILCRFLEFFVIYINRWWAPSKFDPVKSPMLFFKNGQPIIPPISPDRGLDMVLDHMVWQCFLFSLMVKTCNVDQEF